MVRRKYVPLPAPTGLHVFPAELAHRPPMPLSMNDYTAWRNRRREWFRANGLLINRGTLDWQKVTRTE